MELVLDGLGLHHWLSFSCRQGEGDPPVVRSSPSLTVFAATFRPVSGGAASVFRGGKERV